MPCQAHGATRQPGPLKSPGAHCGHASQATAPKDDTTGPASAESWVTCREHHSHPRPGPDPVSSSPSSQATTQRACHSHLDGGQRGHRSRRQGLAVSPTDSLLCCLLRGAWQGPSGSVLPTSLLLCLSCSVSPVVCLLPSVSNVSLSLSVICQSPSLSHQMSGWGQGPCPGMGWEGGGGPGLLILDAGPHSHHSGLSLRPGLGDGVTPPAAV